jgi:hypothetical protein
VVEEDVDDDDMDAANLGDEIDGGVGMNCGDLISSDDDGGGSSII